MMDYDKKEYTTDVLVIGGGIAAVFAATRAKKNGASVMMIDKGSIGRSGESPFASGMSIFDEDEGHDRATWHKIMYENAEKLNNPAYLDVFMDYSKGVYEDLEAWGATKVGFGKVFRNKILKENITVLERTMVTTLLENNGSVIGAVGFKLDKKEAIVVNAKAVILCTGAGAFKPNGFQVCSLTFDGDAMAYRIGAKISGKEFVDTHITNGDSPAYCWGQWSHMWSLGLPKMVNGPLEGGGMALDLSASHMAHTGNIPIEMPKPEGPPPGSNGNKPPDRPPKGEGDKPAGGPGDNPIGGASAGMGVHKSEGLFPSDNKCGTNIKGLFAAGDCLSSMLVGPIYNGVIGFSMTGSGTQGALAGETAAKYIKNIKLVNISSSKRNLAIEEMFQPLNNTKGYSPQWVEHMIQGILTPYYVLYIKEKSRLEAALTNVEFYRDHFLPKLRAIDLHDLRKAHEVKNMLLNAEMKLKASLFRTESRGNHYREDYPDSNDTDWLAWVVMEKDTNGNMKLEKFNVKDFKKLIV